MRIFSPRSALFFDREEVKLILGALIFIFPNLFEDLKWKEDAQLAVWSRYQEWKEYFAKAIRADLKKNDQLLKFCQKRAKEHLTLHNKTTYAFAALIYQLLEYPMFSDYLGADMKGNKTDLRASYNIALVTKLLSKFEYLYNVSVLTPDDLKKTLQRLFNHFLRFIIEGGIEEYEDFDEFAPTGCVSFMTIHQSKGLEFPIVMVGSLNAVPRKQYDETDVILQNSYFSKPPFEPIEKTKFYDFNRLFYTAFSRAQNLLVLTTNEKEGKGKSPSKYFEPLYKKLSSWRDAEFDKKTLVLDKVKAVNIKHEYSFTSHILLYENCPLQYKFYKELEFVEVRTGAALGGSLLHQTIEDIHKAVLRHEEHKLTNENITNWFNNNYYLLSKQHRSYLHKPQADSLLRQVLRYRDANTGKWDRIKEAEVEVSLVKENYILSGKIDLIKGENGTVELVDFKSGDKPDVNSTDPITVRTMINYRRQLEVYAHLVEERTGEKVSKLHLYYPKEDSGNPNITFPYEKGNIERTISDFAGVVDKIEEKNYDMAKIVKSEK
ncbi:MAG TPA: PD-(D/E)XK nuclease family protein, partial [Bacteroidia bacterium]|nr:PD-(D/E)XK nuclease family protein [Bacteroidia bacterium]